MPMSVCLSFESEWSLFTQQFHISLLHHISKSAVDLDAKHL